MSKINTPTFKESLYRVVKDNRRQILMDEIKGTQYLSVRIVDVNSDKELSDGKRRYNFEKLISEDSKVKFAFDCEDVFIQQFDFLMSKYF